MIVLFFSAILIFNWNLDILGIMLYDYGLSLNLYPSRGVGGHCLIIEMCVPYSVSITTWGEWVSLLLLDMVRLILPTWPPLIPPWLGCAECPALPPCGLHWHCGLGWRGKLYYHQVGRKSPVSSLLSLLYHDHSRRVEAPIRTLRRVETYTPQSVFAGLSGVMTFSVVFGWSGSSYCFFSC